MIRGALVSVLLLAAATACGGDDTPETVQVQQASDSAPVASPASPPPAGALSAPGSPAPSGGRTAGSAAGTGSPGASTAVAAANAEVANASRLRTVQVASFINPATAQALVVRLERDGVPAWTATTTVGGEQFTRVRVGAAVTAAEARALANRITAQYSWPVWITLVENRSAVSGSVLAASRSYAEGR